MIMVDKIASEIPVVAAFIFRENESDEVHYSSDIRLGRYP